MTGSKKRINKTNKKDPSLEELGSVIITQKSNNRMTRLL